MGKPTFKPKVFSRVDASKSHGPGASYRVAYGEEDWNGKSVMVYKVQMEYYGRVHGRKAPSYPVDSDDFERVSHALKLLRFENERKEGHALGKLIEPIVCSFFGYEVRKRWVPKANDHAYVIVHAATGFCYKYAYASKEAARTKCEAIGISYPDYSVPLPTTHWGLEYQSVMTDILSPL